MVEPKDENDGLSEKMLQKTTGLMKYSFPNASDDFISLFFSGNESWALDLPL
jgi:hypothetical protein